MLLISNPKMCQERWGKSKERLGGGQLSNYLNQGYWSGIYCDIFFTFRTCKCS